MMSGLDWDDLRFFLAVARTGSFSVAARHLRVDHSTVSRKIADLESSFGRGVFERHRTGIRLTELGQAILDDVQAMEGGALRIQDQLSSGEANASGSVRVATMEGIASLYIAPRLGLFRKELPNVRLELVTSAQLVQVNRREAEIFISFFQPSGRGLVAEKVGTFRVFLYGSEKYLSKMGMPERISDLEQHHFVAYIDDLVQMDTVRWLEEIVPRPYVVFQSNSMIAQMGAASDGVGLVMLPAFSVRNMPKLIPILPEQVSVTRELWINVHSDLQFSPKIKAVTALFKKLFHNDQEYLMTGRE